MKLLAGDASGLSEFISPKCKGVLGDVRDGKATEKQVEELKKTFTNINLVGKPRKESSTTVFTLKNGDGATITMRVKKEGDAFRLTEYTVKAASAAKKGR